MSEPLKNCGFIHVRRVPEGYRCMVCGDLMPLQWQNDVVYAAGMTLPTETEPGKDKPKRQA